MTADELKSFLDEMSTFFHALDKVLPDKIDGQLINWIESVREDEWTCELLLKVLSKIKK